VKALFNQFEDLRGDLKRLLDELERLNSNIDQLEKLNDNLEALNSNLRVFLVGRFGGAGREVNLYVVNHCPIIGQCRRKSPRRRRPTWL